MLGYYCGTTGTGVIQYCRSTLQGLFWGMPGSGCDKVTDSPGYHTIVVSLVDVGTTEGLLMQQGNLKRDIFLSVNSTTGVLEYC